MYLRLLSFALFLPNGLVMKIVKLEDRLTGTFVKLISVIMKICVCIYQKGSHRLVNVTYIGDCSLDSLVMSIHLVFVVLSIDIRNLINTCTGLGKDHS
jgi:hypothetical protein